MFHIIGSIWGFVQQKGPMKSLPRWDWFTKVRLVGWFLELLKVEPTVWEKIHEALFKNWNVKFSVWSEYEGILPSIIILYIQFCFSLAVFLTKTQLYRCLSCTFSYIHQWSHGIPISRWSPLVTPLCRQVNYALQSVTSTFQSFFYEEKEVDVQHGNGGWPYGGETFHQQKHGHWRLRAFDKHIT